jgi:hypothetical protein
MKKDVGAIIITTIFALILLGNFPAALCYSVGVRSGDWIEYNFQESNGDVEYTQRIDFVNVSGAALTLNIANVLPSGEELPPQSLGIDLTTSEDYWISYPLVSARTLIIPNGTNMGDSVYLGLFGNETILGQTTRTYADVDRTVVYANFSFRLNGTVDNQYTLYWDKLTGVLVEATNSYESASLWSLSTVDTNMWIGGIGWWFWVIVVGVVAAGILSAKRNAIRKLLGKPSAASVGKAQAK